MRDSMQILLLFLTAAVLAAGAPARVRAADVAAPASDSAGHFLGHVRPLLQSKCVSCHGPEEQEGGLRLDSQAAVLKGGDSGPAVVAGDPAASLLLKAVRHTAGDKLKMPPKETLGAAEMAALERWAADGAVWVEPPVVLFEDEAEVAAGLTEGSGPPARVVADDKYAGTSALLAAPQRFALRVPGWRFPIAENPGPGQYRYLRFAWKKRGGGGGMIFEVPNDGQWRPQTQTNGAWSAGPNRSGWGAISLSDAAPSEWTVVTRDLWADGGDWGKDTGHWPLTGISLSSLGADGTGLAGEALIDSVILGPTVESLDAYKPGRGILATKPARPLGDAWADPENPITRLFKGERLDLWSLKKPAPAEPPGVRAENEASVKTPVDRFILAALEAKGLKPSPEADPRVLVRRLYFDLTGLPPTPEEVAAFVADDSPGAYDRLVERLLASPRYGERWGRYWLDVVRYADTNGFERDEFRPNTFRYRDYVIRSFNADKPYDQFIREQLAGDELLADPARPATPEEADKVIATGFLRLGQYDSTGSIFQEDEKGRDQLMADLANTTGSALLGLTMSCANCHDHKYDPISQADHFRLRAFFAAVQPRDDIPAEPPAAQAEIDRHNAAVDAQVAEVQRRIAELLAPAKEKIAGERRAALPTDIQALLKTEEAARDEATKERLKPHLEALNVSDGDAAGALGAAEKTRHDELNAKAVALIGRKRAPATALAVTDSGRAAPATHLFYQGDFTQPRDEVQPGFLSVLDPNPAAIPPPSTGNAKTSDRRSALAAWVASADNPLTARVMVNRIWQGHFGTGLVATPNDFGYSGTRPSNPPLLDWLAGEFVRSGWSVKHMHRLIVRSAAYRQISTEDPARKALDPENVLLWRQNIRRHDAEALRDSVLAVSGLLLPDDAGPPRWPPVAAELLDAQPAILETHSDEGARKRLQGWYADPIERTFVRSVFLVQKRSLAVPFLQPFDLPETTVSCARRSTTTVAPQSLTLLNNEFTLRAARAFAGRVRKDAGDDPAKQAERAVWLALSRPPDAEEKAVAADLLARHAKLHAERPEDAKEQPTETPERAALTDLCRMLLNLNEFVYVD